MAVAFALMFFAGNIYYTLHTLIAAAFITLIYLFERGEKGWRWDRLRRVIIGSVFAFGLSALQFMPIWVVRSFVSHESVSFDLDGRIIGNYDMPQAMLNYIFPWNRWAVLEQPDFGQYAVVDYAYVGVSVFLFIVLSGLLQFILRRHLHQRPAIIAFVLAVVMTVWGAAQTPLLEMLYARIELLAEFRYVGRALSIGALWWIVLAAISIDVLWRSAHEVTGVTTGFDQYDRTRLLRVMSIGVLLWLYVMAFSAFGNSERFALAFSSPNIYTFLTERTFMTFQQAAEVLWWFVLLAVVIDTILLVAHELPLLGKPRMILRMVGARSLRLVILVLAMTAIGDVMYFNSGLFQYGRPVNDFRPLYELARAGEPNNPIPAVREPYSPSAYDAYYAEMRNFGLDEGWSPVVLPNILPNDAPQPAILPGWAIVSNEYGGASYALSRDYVADKPNERIQCNTPFVITEPNTDPCDLEDHPGSILYRLTDAPPYSFVVTEQQLLTRADTINSDTVHSVKSIQHEQDSITIQAEPPTTEETAYLIIQEALFPGWLAFVDGLPVEPLSYERTTAIRMLPGEHTYTLRFQPPGFSTGITLFVITLVGIVLYLHNTKRAARSRTALEISQDASR
jgi:hypothetical protein